MAPRRWSRASAIVLLILALTTTTSALTNLTVAGLFSLGGAGATWDGTASYKAAQLALLHVNSDPDILSGYHLKIDVRNSKCRAGDGVKGFVELINEPPTKIMILGASCSVVSQPVAETSQHWNLVQMSFSSASDALSGERYPNFFRTNPAMSAFNAARLAILKEYGWQRIATLHDSDDLYTIAVNLFLSDLSRNNITLVTKETFETGQTPVVQLTNIKDKNARVIICSAFEVDYRKIFCEAYRQGMYGDRYVWIIESWNSHDWWRNVSRLGCSDAQMYRVLQNYIGTNFQELRSDEAKTVSGLTASQYLDAYTSFTDGVSYNGEEFGPFAYDAVWAVALALHEVSRLLRAQNASHGIEDFHYDDAHRLRERFLSAVSGLDFEGVSGSVSFDETGNRLSPLKIEQLIGDTEEVVGIYEKRTGLQWSTDEGLTFTGGAAPSDGPVREVIHLGIGLTEYVVFSVFAVAGMVLTVVFLIVNIKFRAKRLIKMSCPNVNNVIAVGCFMCYLDVIVAGLNGNPVSQSFGDQVCLAQVWILPIAFSLAFGGLFAKTWRVHVIFSNKRKRTKIFDSHLFVLIGVVVAIDVIIISVWTAYDPSRMVQTTLPEEIDTEADKIYVRILDKCDSPNSPQFLWIGIIFVWKGILLIFGAFLAWETRTVTMPQLNDSKYIAVAIYNVAIPSIIIAPLVTLISKDMPGTTYVLSASCIIFGTTVTNCLIFIPKIKALLQQDANDGSDGRPACSYGNQVGAGRLPTDLSTVDVTVNMEREIHHLKRQIDEKDAEIQRLTIVTKEGRTDQNSHPER